MIYEAAAIINENSCVFIRPKKRGDINYVEIKVGLIDILLLPIKLFSNELQTPLGSQSRLLIVHWLSKPRQTRYEPRSKLFCKNRNHNT